MAPALDDTCLWWEVQAWPKHAWSTTTACHTSSTLICLPSCPAWSTAKQHLLPFLTHLPLPLQSSPTCSAASEALSQNVSFPAVVLLLLPPSGASTITGALPPSVPPLPPGVPLVPPLLPPPRPHVPKSGCQIQVCSPPQAIWRALNCCSQDSSSQRHASPICGAHEGTWG